VYYLQISTFSSVIFISYIVTGITKVSNYKQNTTLSIEGNYKQITTLSIEGNYKQITTLSIGFQVSHDDSLVGEPSLLSSLLLELSFSADIFLPLNTFFSIYVNKPIAFSGCKK
jgi:hypothetical protein